MRPRMGMRWKVSELMGTTPFGRDVSDLDTELFCFMFLPPTYFEHFEILVFYFCISVEKRMEECALKSLLFLAFQSAAIKIIDGKSYKSSGSIDRKRQQKADPVKPDPLFVYL